MSIQIILGASNYSQSIKQPINSLHRPTYSVPYIASESVTQKN